MRFIGPQAYITSARQRETHFLLLMIIFFPFLSYFPPLHPPFSPWTIPRPSRNFFSPTNPLTPLPRVPPAPQLCSHFSVDYFSVHQIEGMDKVYKARMWMPSSSQEIIDSSIDLIQPAIVHTVRGRASSRVCLS